MSTPCIVLVVSFIVLTVAQVCTAEEHDSLNNKDAAVVAAIKEVGKTMECFATTLKRGLRYQQQNDDVMRGLQTLPDMLKEQIAQQNRNCESAREKEFAASEKVDALIEDFKEVKTYIMNKDKVESLTEEIKELKKNLEKKDKTIQDLEHKLAESELQVSNNSDEEKRLKNAMEQLTNSNVELNTKVAENDKKVRDLEQRLVESTQQVNYLSNNEKLLNNTVEQLTNTNAELNTRVADSDKKVRDLEQRLAECTQQVNHLSNNEIRLNNTVEQLTNSNAELTTKVADNDKKVQYLEERLQKSQQLVQKLENTIKQLNETVKHENKQVDKCTGRQLHQQQQKINELVRAYSNNKNWDTLQTGLEAVLDHSSEAYKQLQAPSSSSQHFNIGAYNNRELVLLLLCAGMPVNTPDSSYRYTILHGAAREGHIQLTQLLLQHGADINIKDSFNDTPLMWAVLGNQLEMVRLLVEAGADTTARDHNGRTALDMARHWSKTSVIPYLEQLPH